MKKVFLTLIVGVLVFDLIPLYGMVRGYLPSLTAWLRYPSECSLRELIREVSVDQSASASAAEVTLERTEAGLDLWNTPRGKMWAVHGDTLLRFLTYEQIHDIYELPGHEIHKGDVVLDCGANIGVFTRTALLRGASLVVAIEPAPQTLNALRRNFETEIREGRVIVYPKGVWDHDAEMELTINEAIPARNTLVLPQDTPRPIVRVPLTTIDEIVGELKLNRVDFIKMDIEGAEKQAINGGRNTIKRFRPRMSLSTEHLDNDFTAIPALIQSIDPHYAHKGCDCYATQKHIKALVLAFDPLS